jgi:hypothetical protein
MLQFLIVLAILAAVVVVVTAPIRRARAAQASSGGRSPADRAGALSESVEIAELEAARDAKYREIRDAELDHRTGKLSDADFDAVDRVLRAEAIEILNALDRARGETGAADSPESAGSPDGASQTS